VRPAHRRRRASSLATAALLVLLTPLALVAAPAAVPVALAADGSLVSGFTTYSVEPAERRVRAHVVLSVENTKPDLTTISGTTRYYYPSWSIAVQQEARHVRATRDGEATVVTVQQRSGYKLVLVTIAPAIFLGSTAMLVIDYDLPDGGARADSQVRVGEAFATFVAYAHGDDRATVRVIVPSGYEVTMQGDPMRAHVDATGTTLTTEDSVNAQAWYAVVTADRPEGLWLRTLRLPIAGQDRVVEVRAWPEDEAWSSTVVDELTRGLPELGRLIGLDWPVSGPLEVQEAYTPLLGGYAGFYTQGGAGALDQIRVTEEPDPFVILHEASHAWFNADLLEGRWINEGLADQYAALVLLAIGGAPTSPDPVDRSAAAAFPLNSWPPPGRIDDSAADEREQYGYATSWMIVRTLFDEIGAERMRGVIAAAAAGEIAYIGRPTVEDQGSLVTWTDWRYFLDLLEQRGGSEQAAVLFRTWVVGDEEAPSLATHEAARAAYATLVERGDGWLPGMVIRSAMARWELGPAQAQLDEAGQVLDLRTEIASLETALTLTDGGVLRDLYEDASSSYDRTIAVARDELTTLGRLTEANDAVGAERGPLTTIGLWGTDPASDLAAADEAYRSGDLKTARGQAARAAALIAAAEEVGTQRVALGLGGAGLVVVSTAGLVLVRRRRRIRARVAAEAPATLGDRPGQGQGDQQA